MVARTEVLAVIPARGGSKGIPHKNIRDFAGYPLIAYSIVAGLQAETVTRVIVSTDDEKIAAVARQWGAETPFLRPAEFAQDQTTDLPVFQHALKWLAENEGYRPDVVVQLRPTSPVRPVGLVDEAVRMLLARPEADSVRGVVPAGQNPHKMWRIDPGSGQMKNLLDVPGLLEPYNAPRQALPPVFWQTGHVDAIRPRAILEMDSMSGRVILPVMIVVTGIAPALGLFPGALSHETMSAFLGNWLIKLIVLGMVTLACWHAAHRLRVCAHDFGIRADGVVAIVLYGLAALGTFLTLIAVVRI